MTDSYVYTVITFAPVQGFIEKSRKLRDLYGSSFLLSYLSWIICTTAKSKKLHVVSPAQVNVIQGTPNQIIIKGDLKEQEAKAAFNKAWKCITESCREWIEFELRDDFNFCWKRNWDLWTKHAWEFFWVQGKIGETVSQVRQKLNDKKYGRAWTAINWQGESSTLSGADAIAHPELGKISDPRAYNYNQEKTAIQDFYNKLSEKLGDSFIKITRLYVPDSERSIRSQEYGESFINPREELSIPELIKRLITHQAIGEKIIERFKKEFGDNQEFFAIAKTLIQKLYQDLRPDSFKDISRYKIKRLNDKLQLEQQKFYQGWFQGDGDKAGDYLKKFEKCSETEASEITAFSEQMCKWGKDFYDHYNKQDKDCRIVYAGGDDFLGVFYKADKKQKLEPKDCVDWFSKFNSEIWHKDKEKPITVSVGFVWAPFDVPQRDVLQHCREAEKSAKSNGRDRIAFRVLFNNGNYIEWVCPWWLLEQGLLSSYRDRENKLESNWTHIYNDVAVLESRHAFNQHNVNIAFGLLDIYFPTQKLSITNDVTRLDNQKSWRQQQENILWNHDGSNGKLVAGILGDKKSYYKEDSEETDDSKVNQSLNNWVINLAKVGFHLCEKKK